MTLNPILLILSGYYLGFLIFIGLLHLIPGIHKEFIRKSYHVMCAVGNVIIISISDQWHTALIIHVSIFGLAFILLKVFSKTRFITSLYLDRNWGTQEISKQLIFFIFTFSLSVFLFWGYLGETYKGIASFGFLLWGVGDAAAAIIGKLYGTIRLKRFLFLLSSNKSFQGCLGLFISTFVTALLALPHYLELPGFWSSLPGLILLAFMIAIVAGITETVSVYGSDTISFPLAVSLFTYLLIS